MLKLVIDLPSTPICIPQIQINPLTNTFSDPTNPQQQPQFCLTLAILLLPYGYILYWYLSSLYTLHTKQLLHQMDTLDISLTIISILRLCVMFIIPIIQHRTGILILNILALWWQIILMFIFVKFVMEQRRIFQYVVWGTFIVYGFFMVVSNYFSKASIQMHQNQRILHVPVLVPLLLVTLALTIISILQLISIQSSLTHSLLTPTITIQLKTRKSFIFLTITACWISLLMKKYPQIFKPILGVVLYFIISQWINIAIAYRMIVGRIIRRNQQSDISSQDRQRGRQSGVVLVEMKGYGYRR